MTIWYQMRYKLFNLAFKGHHKRLQSIFKRERGIEFREEKRQKRKRGLNFEVCLLLSNLTFVYCLSRNENKLSTDF